MAERAWDRFLTDDEKAVLAATPTKTPYGFGQRPAVLSVDNYRGGIGDRPEPLIDSMKLWPSSTGLAGWVALGHIAELFAAARAANIPVIHITGLPEEESGMAGWSARRRRQQRADPTGDALDRHRRRYDIVEQAAPLPGEVVLKKNSPSAFFGTPLAAHLMGERIDTLVVCGQSTSGCVRATVIDACSYRLRVIVVEECVYAYEPSQAMNLFDMDQKYADVLPLADVLAQFRDVTTWSGTQDS